MGIRLSVRQTLHDDNHIDRLNGKDGRDWFFARIDESADDVEHLEIDPLIELLF